MSVEISIIMPNFNKANFLKETMESVLNQSYKNWELLIIDDASTDGSIEIILPFTRMDQRVILLAQKQNQGGSKCRNIGLANAKGKYVMFLDSDDVLVEECLKQRLSFIQLVKCDFALFHVGTFYKQIGDSSMVWKVNEGAGLKQFLTHELPWNISSPLWEKSKLKELNGFNENFKRFQDVEMHTRALLMDFSYAITTTTSPDCYYRIDSERTLGKKDQLMEVKWKSAIQYTEYFRRKLLEKNKFKEVKYLKGTMLAMLRTLLTSERKSTSKMSERYINELKGLPHTSKLDVLYLRLYASLFKMGFHRIKGFNFVMKKIFI